MRSPVAKWLKYVTIFLWSPAQNGRIQVINVTKINPRDTC